MKKGSARKPQPMQPIAWSVRPQDGPGGIIRFQANAIVRDLLDFAQERGFGLNEMARREYHREDREQFAQLIGYSVSGFGDLSYARRATLQKADAEASRLAQGRSGRKGTRP